MQLTMRDIENRIFTIRGSQVMVDRDLADLYQVDTKVLNQAVKRNGNRFPEAFCYKLTKAEKDELVTNCDRLENLKHSSYQPYVFTEQGVAMLSAVLRSDVAVNVSIQIFDACTYASCHSKRAKKDTVLIDNYIDEDTIDRKNLYHLRSSLKNLGKKWFAFSKLDGMTETVMNNLLKIKIDE